VSHSNERCSRPFCTTPPVNCYPGWSRFRTVHPNGRSCVDILTTQRHERRTAKTSGRRRTESLPGEQPAGRPSPTGVGPAAAPGRCPCWAVSFRTSAWSLRTWTTTSRGFRTCSRASRGAARPPATDALTFQVVGVDSRTESVTDETGGVDLASQPAEVMMVARINAERTGASVHRYPCRSLRTARLRGTSHNRRLHGRPRRPSGKCHQQREGVVFNQGTNHLDGAQVLAYVRQTRGLPRGDLDRVLR
jgi:hypothetical protein